MRREVNAIKRETRPFKFEKTIEKSCAHCGKKFISHAPNGKYCKECRKVPDYRRKKEW